MQLTISPYGSRASCSLPGAGCSWVTPNSSARASRLGGGAVPDATSAPALRRAQIAARAEPPAPRTRARCRRAARAAPRSARSRRCSRPRSRRREAERVRGADLARRLGGAVGERQRRELVRDGDVDAGEALCGQRADQRLELARARPRSPRSSTRRRARARPARRSASPASASGATGWPRTASRMRSAPAAARQHSVGESALGLQRRLVLGLGLRELLLGLDEDVLAAGARLDHEVEAVGLRRVRRGLDRGEARVADRRRRQARVERVLYGRVLGQVGSRSAARRSCRSS